MRIVVNGQSETAEVGSTIADLLTKRHLEPIRVAVEINEDLVPRRSFGQRPIHDGDRVEIVTFVGGG